MKNLFSILFFAFAVSIAFSQKANRTYYHKNETISSAENSYFYRDFYLDTILNKIRIYKVEEYYTIDNIPKKIAFLTESANKSYKYFAEKREYYENGNLESLVKYNIQGQVIDTAYYCYPNGNLKLITYTPTQLKDTAQYSNIQYLGYYDENQSPQLINGTGYIKLPILNYLNPNNYEEGMMQDNLKIGKWKGQINDYTFEEEYQNGTLLKAVSTSPYGKTKEYDHSSLKTAPDYPGGEQSLKEYIGINYQYPQIAIDNGIKGTIIAEFILEPNGTVSDVKIIQDLGYGTAQAAIEVIKKLKDLIPGTARGVPIRSSWTTSINLDLVTW